MNWDFMGERVVEQAAAVEFELQSVKIRLLGV